MSPKSHRFNRYRSAFNPRTILSWAATDGIVLPPTPPAATISAFAATSLSRTGFPEINAAITNLRDILGDEVYESLACKGEAMAPAPWRPTPSIKSTGPERN
jgi:hypothetical protein